MLIQNSTPQININIGQSPQASGAPHGFQNDNRHRPLVDRININIGVAQSPSQRLAGLLPEIEPGNCRRTCRKQARFGGAGKLGRLMSQLNGLLGSQCGQGPRSLAQTPLASPSRCGQAAPQCRPPHQQQAQQLRQLLAMMYDLAQCMQAAQQCCPPPHCGSGGVPASSIGLNFAPCSGGGGLQPSSSRPRPCGSSSYRPSRPEIQPASLGVNTGGPSRVSVSGGPGNDVMRVAGGGHTRLKGGKGDDKISYKASSNSRTVVIRGGKGDDKIKAKGALHTRIHGGKGDDKISYKASSNSRTAVIRGGKGDDKIKAKGALHTRIHGGKGDDTIIYSPTTNSKSAKINGGKGDDTAVIKGNTSIQLADTEGNVLLKRGEGGPRVVLDNVETVRLQGNDQSTTLRLANC